MFFDDEEKVVTIQITNTDAYTNTYYGTILYSTIQPTCGHKRIGCSSSSPSLGILWHQRHNKRGGGGERVGGEMEGRWRWGDGGGEMEGSGE